jgi:hypothetical protein
MEHLPTSVPSFQKCPFLGGSFSKFLNFTHSNITFSLPFSERKIQSFLFSDFSMRLKKIILKNLKMDIFKMFKNVQNRNLMGSLK